MSRARHKAKGGGVKEGSGHPVWNAGGGQNAAKEAEEKKHGGATHHGEGEKSKRRADKRARGGKVEHHEEPHHVVKGHSMHHKHGMSIPGRARGGGVGADRTPLTTAAKVKHVTKGETPEIGEPSD